MGCTLWPSTCIAQVEETCNTWREMGRVTSLRSAHSSSLRSSWRYLQAGEGGGGEGRPSKQRFEDAGGRAEPLEHHVKRRQENLAASTALAGLHKKPEDALHKMRAQSAAPAAAQRARAEGWAIAAGTLTWQCTLQPRKEMRKLEGSIRTFLQKIMRKNSDGADEECAPASMLALRNCLSPSHITKSVLSSLAQCFLHKFLRLMAAELAMSGVGAWFEIKSSEKNAEAAFVPAR